MHQQADASSRTDYGTLLVTVLGTNPKQANYTFNGRSYKAALAPLALIQLLPAARLPNTVLALCTREAAEESLPLLERGLAGSAIELKSSEVEADALTDASLFLKKVTGAIPEAGGPTALAVDVTHGFRHFALLTYLTVQYLAVLRRIELRDAFYGLWKPIEQGTSEFLDLRALLDLPKWIYALRVFEDAGDASAFAGLLHDRHARPANDIARELRYISEAREAGLPLELGRLSAEFRISRKKSFKEALRTRGALFEDEIWNRLDESLERFARPATPQTKGWKKGASLSVEELKRQINLIDDLLRRESIPAALGLMNEWTVSWATLRLGGESAWLNYEAGRKPAAKVLGALAALANDPDLAHSITSEQREFGKFWRSLLDLRNAFHHHGMRPQVLVGAAAADVESKFAAIETYWGLLKTLPDVSLAFPATAGGRLLVSPLGLKPGVLSSAIEACRREQRSPEACLVLTSDETVDSVEPALQRAGFLGRVHRLRIADPYGGKDEVKRLVREAKPRLLEATEVLINITGGTTLMGISVAAIATEASQLARESRRFGLIDRRRPEQQNEDPYLASDAFWLEAPDANGD